jgi:3-keto steroid reductase
VFHSSYPHLTTLVLNAGMGAFKGIHWPGAARQFFTDLVGCVSEPDFIIQEKGWKSADGDRGAVWGVNVLSGYILASTSSDRKFLQHGQLIGLDTHSQAKELHSHLLKSPKSLALSPRVLYVSSAKAKPQYLPHPPSADPQLLEEIESYDASKFMGDVVSSRLDWQFSQPETNAVEAGKGRAVRFLRLDPGVVHTGIFVAYLPFILEWCMVAAFYMVSPLGHPNDSFSHVHIRSFP